MRIGTKKDPAFLFFVTAWLQSRRVRAMTHEQRGAYVDLLCYAWLEGSIPADLEELRATLNLPRQRFAAVWSRVAQHWVPMPGDPTRLVNDRQEHEREERRRKVEELRTRGQAGGKRSAEQRASGRQADASPEGQADRQAGGQLGPKPSTPTTTTSTSTPTPPSADGAERAASVTEPDPDIRLQVALAGTGYRSGIADTWRRRQELLRRAGELRATGLEPGDVLELWALAQEKSTGDPGALLAHWLDENLWREVLDERRGKAKESELRARRAATADVLDGVYGA